MFERTFYARDILLFLIITYLYTINIIDLYKFCNTGASKALRHLMIVFKDCEPVRYTNI